MREDAVNIPGMESSYTYVDPEDRDIFCKMGKFSKYQFSLNKEETLPVICSYHKNDIITIYICLDSLYFVTEEKGTHDPQYFKKLYFWGFD